MKTRIKFPEAVSGQLLLLGFGLAVVYWFLEAATDAFVFRKGPFIRQLVPQEPNELWMRMLMAAVIILFSIYAHFVVRRRRNAEKAVREARRRLQNIFTSMTDPVFVVGRDATIQSANPAACSLMGYTEEEFRGMPVGKLFEEEEEEEVFFNVDRTLVAKGGNRIPVLVSGTRIRTESGRNERTVIVAKDITERKRIEEALARSEKQYRDLVDNALVGVYRTNLKGDILYANRALLRMLEFESLEEMQSESVLKRYANPGQRDTLLRILKETGRVSGFEVEVLTKTGRRKHALISAVLEGEFLSGMLMDITGRRESEEKDRAHAERMEALNEASQVLVTSLDFSEVVDRCASIAKNVVDADGATIFLVSDDKTYLEPVVMKEPYAELMAMRLKVGEGVTGEVAASGKAEIVNRIDLTDRGKQIPGTPTEPESLLSAPLKVKEKVIGVITLRRLREWEFSDDDLTFLENVANICAGAIENARLYTNLQESDEESRTLIEKAPDPIIVIDERGSVLTWNRAATRVFGYTKKEILGQQLESIYTSSAAWKTYRQELRSFLKTGKSSHVGVPLEVKAKCKDGRIIDTLISISARKTGRGWVFTAFTKDVTETKQAVKEIQRLAEFPRENPQPVIEMNARGSATYVNPAGKELLKRLKVDENKIDRILPSDYREMVRDSLKMGTDVPATEVEVDGSVLMWTAHPLKELDLVHFYATDITDRKRAEEELRRSYEQIRVLSSRIQTAAEEERMNIAHEIHDELGQALTAIKIDLSWLRKGLAEKKGPLLDRLKSASGIINSAMETVKSISTELRPPLLDEVGLSAAVEWQAGEFEKRTGIPCRLSINPEEIVVDKRRSTALFRIFQEALTNVARHARATRVTAVLEEKDDVLTLKVEDNGVGITREQIDSPTSFGLLGMRERLYPWRGKLTIKGKRGRGTSLEAVLPPGEPEEQR